MSSCRRCGQSLSPDTTACPACGLAVSPSPAGAPAPAPPAANSPVAEDLSRTVSRSSLGMPPASVSPAPVAQAAPALPPVTPQAAYPVAPPYAGPPTAAPMPAQPAAFTPEPSFRAPDLTSSLGVDPHAPVPATPATGAGQAGWAAGIDPYAVAAASSTATPPLPGTGGAAGPMGAPGVTGAVQAADLGTRFLARLLDGALSSAIYVVGALAVWIIGAVIGAISYRAASTVTGLLGLVVLIAMLGFVVVNLVAVGRCGQTIGKRTLGLQVIDVQTSAPVGVGRSFLREVMLMVMGLPCYLGYITFFTDSSGRHRALHDNVAGDVVIRVTPVPLTQSVKDIMTVVRGG